MQKLNTLLFTALLGLCAFKAIAQQPIRWADQMGVSENNGALTKTAATAAWTNAGATSSNALAPNTDGWIEFTVTNQRQIFIGLVSGNYNILNYTNFLNSIYINSSGVIASYEANATTAYGSLVSGDAFRISREGSTVKYLKNGAVIRSVAANPALELNVRAVIYTSGGTTPPVTASFNSKLLLRPIIIGSGGTASTGSINMVAVGGKEPYTYNWSSGEQVGAITGKAQGSYTVTVTDADGLTQSATYSIANKTRWATTTSVTESGEILTKAGAVGWNAGAVSSNLLAPNTDGWVEFVVNGFGHSYEIGFGLDAPNYAHTGFRNAVMINSTDGMAYTYESSTVTSLGAWRTGDVFRISRVGGSVNYHKNGTIVRTVAAAATDELQIKASVSSGNTPAISASFDAKIVPLPLVSGTGFLNGTGSISVNSTGGVPPYNYSWPGGELTNSIADKTRGGYTVTVTDAEGRTQVSAYNIGYKSHWQNQANVTESAGMLTRTGTSAWNAGANGSNVLPANTDGWIEFVVNGSGSNYNYMIGFGHHPYSYNYVDFRNAIQVSNATGLFYTYELSVGTTLKAFRAGDVFRISREGATVKYYRNGAVLRTVATNPIYELYAKVSIHTGSSPLVTTSFDARLLVNATVTGTQLANGSGGIALNLAVGTAPYTYSWSSGEATGSISNKNRGDYSVVVTDAEGRQKTNSYKIGYRPYWLNHTNATESAGILTKTSAAGWNAAGANSSNVLPANTDGWIEFVVNQTASTYMVGFGNSPSGFNYLDFRNGLFVGNAPGTTNSIYSYEATTGTDLGAIRAGDVCRIAREGATVKYYRNGAVLRTVATNPIYELYAKVSIHTGSSPLVTSSFDARLVPSATVVGTGINSSSGSITLNVAGGTPPYTYNWSSGEQTSSIVNKNRNNYTVTITDAEGRQQGRTYAIGCKPAWVDHLGVEDDNGLLTKTNPLAWGNSGANNFASLPPNTDGWVEFVANGSASSYAIGFATNLTAFSNNSFTNGLQIDHATGALYTNDPAQTLLGSYQPGDVFRVSRLGGAVKYLRNGTEIRSVAVSPTLSLRIKASIYQGSVPAATSSFEASEVQVALNEYAFQYRYDGRRRMTHKKVPGADWVYMVYDDRDRLAMTQDGNQRKANQWAYTKYDALNRPIITGIYTHTASIDQPAMAGLVKTAPFFETYNGSAATHGYTNTVFTAPNFTVANFAPLTVTYYDNYDFRSTWLGTYTYVTDGLTATVPTGTYTQPATGSENVRVIGQVTGSKTKVLDGGIAGGPTWLKSILYYDDKYRVVQTQADNYKGGIDRVSNLYDFVGKVLKTKTMHTTNDLQWTDMVGTVVVGNKLEKIAAGNAWGTAGAVSVERLPANTDGWIEWVAHEQTTFRVIGLSSSNINTDPLTVHHGLYLRADATLWRHESGAAVQIAGGYKAGDIFRIERAGGSVTYKKNNVPISNSTITSLPLMVDVSLYNSGGSVQGITTSFSMESNSVTRTFKYDHAGRLLETWHQLEGQPEILLAKNEYNELGQLVDKKLHSTTSSAADAKQSVDYRYNIRGWLTSINNAQLANGASTNDDTNDLFGMELGYNLPFAQVNDQPTDQLNYNGNISAIKWSNYPGIGRVKQKAYTYTYDPMNRILGSTFKEHTSSWAAPAGNGFAETGFSYDLNGNIRGLTRNDKRSNGTMDVLAYEYYDYGTGAPISNKLMKVTDSGDDFTGFVDGTNSGYDYTYDANGNMLTDQNKGITSNITYNYLNLPETVVRGGTNHKVQYIYDATGRKLAQAVTYSTTHKQTEYAGEFQYENDVLQFVSHEEGRIAVGATQKLYFNEGDNTAKVTASNATLAIVTQNGEQKYLKVTSSSNLARSGISQIGGLFPVQGGERYKVRAKGYRATNPVYMVVKANGADLVWPGAALAGSLATEAWAEQVVTLPAGATQMTVGITWGGTVANGEIFYLNDFEVEKLTSQQPEYQYHLKDHLGNVRLTFTSKPEADDSKATMEVANANIERSKFLKYDDARFVYSSLFDRTNGTRPSTTLGYSVRLSGTANEKIGLSRSLSVMPGDEIDMEAFGKYFDPNAAHTDQTAWNDLVALIGNVAAATAGVVVDGAGYTTSAARSLPFPNPINYGSADVAYPKAYLNWLIFDRDRVFLDGGFKQLLGGQEDGTDKDFYQMAHRVTIKEPGYVYVWLSNDNPTPVECYFDDFKVTHTKSPVIESTDYYPFGLISQSYQRENSLPNQNLYNGKELQDELNLGWYDYLARQYDPVLGRFLSVDPLADFSRRWSPYSFAFNNPIRFIDPDGMLPEDEVKKSRSLEVTSSKSSDRIKETNTSSSTSRRTVSEGSQEFTDLLGKSTIRGNGANGIGSEISVVETTTTSTETITDVEYDDDGNEVSRNTSEVTTTSTTTNVVVKDKFGGDTGGFVENSSNSVASKNPTPSSALSGLTSDAVNYRSANGASITNRNEFAGKVAAQRNAYETWDKYNPTLGVLSGLRYGSGPSLLLGGASQVISMSLERGLKGLEYKSKNDPCNNCTKSYPVNQR
jgi:RHS repeat-associated protein